MLARRVWKADTKEWIADNIYFDLDENIFIHKKNLLGNKLIELEGNYVVHNDIDLYDKNGILIYEGDYIKAQVAEDRIVSGVVIYAHELSSYIILCFDSEEYFTLGSQVCEFIQIVGNVFDGYKEEENGQQTLQEEAV